MILKYLTNQARYLQKTRQLTKSNASSQFQLSFFFNNKTKDKPQRNIAKNNQIKNKINNNVGWLAIRNVYCFSSTATQTLTLQTSNKINNNQNHENQQLKNDKILENAKMAAKYLKQYDSLFLDDCCDIFSSLFISKHPKQIEREQQKRNAQKGLQINSQINGQKIIKQIQTKIITKILKRLQQHYKTNNQDQFNVDQLKEQAETIYFKIKTVFYFLDKSKIGFLRGDLHSQTMHKLYTFIEQFESKVNNQMTYGLRLKGQKQKFDVEQFRNFFNQITDNGSFRLPQKGIKYRQLQTKNNLYQRQLTLQSVSNQQAFQKFNSILQSLASMNKAHLTQVSRKQIIQWLPPIIKAIKDQQSKCKLKDTHDKRKIYGEYLLKINAQKIATIILYDLVAAIYEILFRGGSDDCFQANQFHGISQKRMCKNICQLIISQIVFEKEQKKFRQVQKIYDFVLNMQPKFSKEELVKQNQYKKIQELTKYHINPEYLIEYLAVVKTDPLKSSLNENNINSKTNQSPQQASQEAQSFKRKYALRQFLQQKFEYKYIRPEDRKLFVSELVNKITKRDSWRNNIDRQEIPEEAQVQIGQLLIGFLKDLIKIKNKYGFSVPLLIPQKKFITNKGDIKIFSILKLNEHFLATILPKIQKQGDLFMHQDRSIPTIIPPLPWVQPQVGGYYLQATNIMRYSECTLQERLVRYADMSRVYNVLNYLSSIAWQINKKVLAVVQEIWAEGGGFGQIPVRYTQLITQYTIKAKNQKNPKIIKQYTKKINQLRDCHSLRCDFLLKLAIARSFSKVDKFYFPHNIDFRGRVYPVTPHFNHIGNDLARGLLLFGQGKKLGQSGVKWLKIHCANLMGKDKATIPQKLAFIQDNLHLIKQIGSNPLKNREWLKNQDSWQSLGAIIQLNDALNHNPPEQYISYLHIHQDGSCNGLQHYAALGRDMQGAYQVNLGVTPRPGDVYTHVAKMVIQMINKDIADPENQNRKLAQKLTDNIKRKTIKQTVMTSVYGVTFIGARQQIHRQLKDQRFLNQDDTYQASIYVAKLTLKAISNLFLGAHNIKQWLISCAKLIAESNNPVGWITPMGLPVVQPYRTLSKFDMISTVTQILKVPPQSQLLPINKSKQKSAFPPNFVHSLDSSHMMYTAQQCSKRNLTFAAVHDSYWTHAGKVEEMNIILREMFVKLHSEPLLQSLKNSFQLRYPQIKFPDIPKRGQFNLQLVKESVYFFS